MSIRWPLARWDNKVGISSATRRMASLGGRRSATETTLGDLRKFVASLEQWPDRANVTQASGAVLDVEYFDKADPLVRESGDVGRTEE